MRYSVDSSSLIQGFRDLFPYVSFPTFWNRDLANLVEVGDLRATEAVKWEIEEQDDELLDWISELEDLFVAIDEPIQHEVRTILEDHARLLHAGRSGADAFVIALARLNGATVVCEERGGKPTRPKIPYVCDALGIRCIRLIEVVREQGWTY